MRMSRSNTYWQNRVARQMYAHQQDADKMLADLVRYYIASSHYMQTEAEKILKKFQTKHHLSRREAERLLQTIKDPSDIKALIAALKQDPQNAELAAELESQAYAARISRLRALHSQVDSLVIGIAAAEGSKGAKAILDIAKDAYYNKIFDLQQYSGAAFPFKLISEKRIKDVINRSWAGSGFSDRIWGNAKKLEDAVKREIAIGIMTGRPTRQTALAIDDEFRKGYNNAKRLIRTETTYVTNQMHKAAYKEAEVEKYIYVATLDLRTSKVCRSLDGKTFPVSEAKVGVNYPPMHPNCRSVTIAWLPDKWLAKMKRRAWDPSKGRTILVPANMTYQQWYDKYVLGKQADVKDVTDEYLKKAKPGTGKVEKDPGYPNDKNHAEDEKSAKWLVDNFGGDVRLTKERRGRGIKTADAYWRNAYIEFKRPSTISGMRKRVRKGISQIDAMGNPNVGRMLIDIGHRGNVKSQSMIDAMLDEAKKRRKQRRLDIILRDGDKLVSVYRIE